MSGGLSGIPEQDAIIARTKQLLSGRVWPGGVPDEVDIPKGSDDLILPYIVVAFGAMYPKATDRTIEGEEQQPHLMPVFWECWGPDWDKVRRTAAALRVLFTGWAPDPDNAAEIALRNGGTFQQRSSNGRPSRWMEAVNAVVELNLSTEAWQPTPGGDDVFLDADGVPAFVFGATIHEDVDGAPYFIPGEGMILLDTDGIPYLAGV